MKIKITVKDLKKELEKFSGETIVTVYEGEKTGIVFWDEQGNQIGFIETV